jgi:hypothetical protein
MGPLPLQSTVAVVSVQLSAETPASSIDPQPAESLQAEFASVQYSRGFPSEIMRLWLLLKSNLGHGPLLP